MSASGLPQFILTLLSLSPVLAPLPGLEPGTWRLTAARYYRIELEWNSIAEISICRTFSRKVPHRLTMIKI